MRLLCLLLLPALALAQPLPRPTYCNPLNLDYGYTPFPEFSTAGRHRATADPVVTLFKGTYYLFSTNQRGYWWSTEDRLSFEMLSRSMFAASTTGMGLVFLVTAIVQDFLAACGQRPRVSRRRTDAHR